MMWILVWMQLVTNQGVDYYQLGNYGKKRVHVSIERSGGASQPSSETLACLEVDTR